MKIKYYLPVYILLTFVLSGCNKANNFDASALPRTALAVQAHTASAVQKGLSQAVSSAQLLPTSSSEAELASLLRSLDELAELERAGSWFQGMAITESSIRERMGDYAGAVAAAFKEMSRAYGVGLIRKTELEQSLLNILNTAGEDTVIHTVNAIQAFQRGQWPAAADELRSLFIETDEPDGFAGWMILVCDLEKNTVSSAEGRRAAQAYRSIRARYVHFPEYWYRGAKAFSGIIAADYAEKCINLSPLGPFADECRSILASYAGLKTEDSSSIKTMKEIEDTVTQAVNSSNPELLNSLFPLISLPDNPYTVYAVSALRSVTGISGFREYFSVYAAAAGGRLAERLSYISLG